MRLFLIYWATFSHDSENVMVITSDSNGLPTLCTIYYGFWSENLRDSAVTMLCWRRVIISENHQVLASALVFPQNEAKGPS